MEPANKVSKCGVCDKNIYTNSRAIYCNGICSLWYHSAYVGISNDEYPSIHDLGNTITCKCDKCQSPDPTVSTNNNYSNSDYDNKYQQYFDHIKILNDQIWQLSEKHKNFY